MCGLERERSGDSPRLHPVGAVLQLQSPSSYLVPIPLPPHSGTGRVMLPCSVPPKSLPLHGHKAGGETGKGPGWDLLHFCDREKAKS